ncbi:MAG: hypothetical protein R2880_11025 [Deinococcales bacterium]
MIECLKMTIPEIEILNIDEGILGSDGVGANGDMTFEIFNDWACS